MRNVVEKSKQSFVLCHIVEIGLCIVEIDKLCIVEISKLERYICRVYIVNVSIVQTMKHIHIARYVV